jgi:hypothetical protein
VAAYHVTEVFFRPPEVARQDSALPADLYHATQRLLARSPTGCVFVPIRSMQYIGVIDRAEVVFVDSQAYAYQGEQGGRLILVAWRPHPLAGRKSLTEPVPCEVIYYEPGLAEVQRRLVGEFGRALKDLERRHRDADLPAQGARILPFERQPPQPKHG